MSGTIESGNFDSSTLPGENAKNSNVDFDSEQLNMGLFDADPNVFSFPRDTEVASAVSRKESSQAATLGKQRLFAALRGHGVKDTSAILREQGISRKRADAITFAPIAKKTLGKKKRSRPPEARDARKARIIASRARAKARTAAN